MNIDYVSSYAYPSPRQNMISIFQKSTAAFDHHYQMMTLSSKYEYAMRHRFVKIQSFHLVLF